jgi:hypothetical protein
MRIVRILSLALVLAVGQASAQTTSVIFTHQGSDWTDDLSWTPDLGPLAKV